MDRLNRLSRIPVTVVFAVLFFFTGGSGAGAESREEAPTIDPQRFTPDITNPLFPLQPGTRWVYEGPDNEGTIERKEVVVTSDTRQVMGVTCVVVHDVVSVDGEVIEDTLDWYAQDADGNVWYFSEDTREMEGGKVVSTEGSWEAGKDGAQPGIMMEADPQVGDQYHQEYYEGQAEDMAEVLSIDEQLTVAHGSYDGVLKTKDWNPLEPGITEHKYYAKDVGTIFEEVVEGETGHLELLEMAQGEAAAEAAPAPGQESTPPDQDEDDDEDEDEGDDEDAAGTTAGYAGVLASSSRSRILAGSTRTPGPMVGARVTALM
jgi:hypothetical protein